MSQLFNKIKVASTSRSTFDLSHKQVTTSDFGYLIPICYRDMVPNDDFVVKPDVFVRLSPLAVPTYGSIKCRIHHFFIPYRICYPLWDSFITQDKNNHTIPPYFLVSSLRAALHDDPQFDSTAPSGSIRGEYGRLMSNLGLNPSIILNGSGLNNTDRVSAFPFLAYYRIWLDWFADTNIYDHPALVAQFNSRVASGGSMAVYTDFLRTRCVCYKKDYYTTAKLNPQDGVSPSSVAVDFNSDISQTNSKPLYAYNNGTIGTANTPSEQHTVVGSFTIEALRAANSLQRYLERNNYVGSKLINRILAHFGVSPTPERLDLAEYIGGSSFPIRIGDVTSTTAAGFDLGLTSGLGFQAGKGVGAGSGESVRYHAKEHGIFMSVMSILPDTAYYQGLSRMWQKGVFGDALDFYHPEFENLGYQELLNKEVYVPYSMSNYQNYDADGIFGYTPRYSEYKFHNDVLAGDFLGVGDDDVMGAPEDSFHLFRTLNYTEADPLALNENFVECDNHNNNFDRIFQSTSTDYDHFYFNINVDVKATRPMVGFGEPSLDSTNNAGDGRTMDIPYGGTRL